MQLTVEREALLRAAGPVSGACPSKPNAPILSHILLTASEERLVLRGTDTDIEIVYPVEASIDTAGAVAVPGRIFHDVIKRMPAGREIGLTLVDDKLKIVCGKSRFQLPTLPAEDFPHLAAGVGGAELRTFEIEADKLRKMLAGVRHAISNDETRYYLNGVYLHIEHGDVGSLRAVATNGHILALEAVDAPVESLSMPAVIVPRETVGQLLKLLPSATDLITLHVSEKRIHVELPGGQEMISKLIEGTFPDYKRVIPSDNPNRAIVDADLLNAAIGRVAAISTEKSSGLALDFRKKKPITICAHTAELAYGQDSVDAEIEGKPARIGVNHRYLGAALDAMAGAKVSIAFNGPADPMLFKIDGSEACLGVVMPMRIDVPNVIFEEAA